MTTFQLDGDNLSKNVSNKATFLKSSSFFFCGGVGGCKIDVDEEKIKVSLITRDNDEADSVTIYKKSR